MLVLNNLTLREVRETDLTEIAHGLNQHELAALAQPTAPLPVSRAQLERHYKAGTTTVTTSGDSDIEFVVTKTDDTASAPLGVAGLYGISWAHGQAELGVAITAREGRGHGLGIDCYIALADYAFHDLRLNRVFGCVKAGNAHALGSLERIQIKPEGLLRQARFRNGRYEDLVIVGVTASDWDPAVRRWRDTAGRERSAE